MADPEKASSALADLDPRQRAELAARAWEDRNGERLSDAFMERAADEWRAEQSDDEYSYDDMASGQAGSDGSDPPNFVPFIDDNTVDGQVSEAVFKDDGGGKSGDLVGKKKEKKYTFSFEEGDERILDPDDTSFEDELQRLNDMMQGTPEGPRQTQRRRGGGRGRNEEADGAASDSSTGRGYYGAGRPSFRGGHGVNKRDASSQGRRQCTEDEVEEADARDRKKQGRPTVPDRLKKKMQEKLDGWKDLGGYAVNWDDDDIIV